MSQIHGMKLAFKDPKMYLLAIGYHCECLALHPHIRFVEVSNPATGIVAASGFQNVSLRLVFSS